MGALVPQGARAGAPRHADGPAYHSLMTEDADDLLARIIDIAMRTRADSSGRIRLPTERELSEMLRVQRPTVRERLTMLETMGFVQRRQGSGTYLSLPTSQFLQLYFEVGLKLGFVSIEQMQKAMEMIGLEMVSNAAIHADGDDIDALERTVTAMQDAASLNQFVDGQFEFHAGLAHACHNPVLSLLIDGMARVIRAVLQNRLRVLSMVRGAFDRNVDAYAAVIQALRDREPEVARTALQECYALWRREASKISMLHLAD
jgi:GntR family transcriptional regulator, transcriptional repressor for pyruvate dehydrogenase complex